MKSIGAGEFKARCLQLMEQVRKQRQTLVVTKRGVPVVKVVPADEGGTPEVFGCLRGRLRILGDIEATVVKRRDWAALR